MFSNFQTRFAVPAAACVALIAGAPVATAQVQNVQPYYAFVTQAETNLRCGPSQNFYSVQTLGNGAILVVDGESQGWNRVLYPVGSEAFVDAKDAKLDDKKVVLTKASQLRAINQTQGFGWSWKMLTETPLAEATSLTHVDSVKEGEIVVGYKVVAPSEARGFVPSSRLRHATQAEVDQYWAAGKALPQLPDVTIATAETAPKRETMAGTATSTTTPGTTTPDGTQVVGATTAVNGANGGAVANAETNTITNLSDLTPEQLESTFQKVWREPITSSEVDELISQYEVALGKVEANQPRRKTAIEQRIAALKVRRDYRDSLRKAEQGTQSVAQVEQQAQQQLDLAAAARVYNIVGSLQPSTVYNGERLPLMYRVVSIGGTSPRTLGYIRKSSELDLDRYLGQVVGVVGENQLDRSLMLNLINAVRVDPLRATGNAVTPAQPTETATQPAAEQVDSTK